MSIILGVFVELRKVLELNNFQKRQSKSRTVPKESLGTSLHKDIHSDPGIYISGPTILPRTSCLFPDRSGQHNERQRGFFHSVQGPEVCKPCWKPISKILTLCQAWNLWSKKEGHRLPATPLQRVLCHSYPPLHPRGRRGLIPSDWW